jgi:hypothetical protein
MLMARSNQNQRNRRAKNDQEKLEIPYRSFDQIERRKVERKHMRELLEALRVIPSPFGQGGRRGDFHGTFG